MRNRFLLFRLDKGKIIYLFFVFFAVTTISQSMAQQLEEIKPIINLPTSPEASKLGTYGDINVNLYNGQPNINIPLYTIKENGIEIPITLSYSSSGIKVSEDASWVGLGWVLSGESAIVQEIRGQADEKDSDISLNQEYLVFRQRVEQQLVADFGFMFQMGNQPDPPTNCGTIEGYGWPYFDYIGDKINAMNAIIKEEGVPDIFNYSIGSISGSFYQNPESKEIIFINPKETIYVEKDIQNSNIVLITLDGVRYTFNDMEMVFPSEDINFSGKTLKLTNITFLNGDKIIFEYDDHTYYTFEWTNNSSINNFGAGTSLPPANDLRYSVVKHTVKTLKRILSKETEVVFNFQDREDLLISDKPCLSSIDILSSVNQNRIKTYEFQYSYFPYNTTGSTIHGFIADHKEELGKRLKLEQLKEIGYDDGRPNDESFKIHHFDYYIINTLPLKCSFAKDFWGYYNGKNNDKLLPDLEYFDFLNKGDLSVINQTVEYPYDGANRYADNSKAEAFLLKKIYYPTGGYSELIYEPNSFTNQFIPDQSSNVRKNNYLADEPANYNNTSITFQIDKSVTINFHNKISNYSSGKPKLTLSEMAGSKIVLYKLSGNPQTQIVIKEWNLEGVNSQDFMNNNGVVFSEKIPIDYDPDPNVFYKVIVDFPQVLSYPTHYGIGVNTHFYYFDHTGVDDTESKQCGARIKLINSYTSLNQLSSSKEYQYQGGRLQNEFKPLFYYFANCCNFKEVTNGVGIEYVSFYKKISLSDGIFSLLGGDPIGYDKVTEINLQEGNMIIGRKEYSFYNGMNTGFHDCPVHKRLTNGLLANEKIIDNNSNSIKEIINFYDVAPQPEYKSVKPVLISTGSLRLCVTQSNSSDPGVTAYFNNGGGTLYGPAYGFDLYKVSNNKITLYKRTEKQTFTNSHVESETQYQYNELGLLSQVNTKRSDGLNNIAKIYYPSDKTVDPIMEEKLIQIHNVGSPSLIENYIENTLISIDKVKYFDGFSGTDMILPKFYFKQNGQMLEECRTVINNYNSEGNITDYVVDSLSRAQLFDERNSLLIAQVNGSKSKESGFSSFENYEANGWILNQQSIISWDPFNTHTGEYYLYGGCQRSFPVGDEALKHEGYTASVWVKGSSQAFIRIEQPENPSSIVEVNNTGAPGEWNLIEVKIPKAKYTINGSLILKVTIGGDANALWDDIRFHPSDASMTTYTYAPLIGMTSQSDANNLPTYYEYDPFGRLKLIRDHKKNILKTFEYNYAH